MTFVHCNHVLALSFCQGKQSVNSPCRKPFARIKIPSLILSHLGSEMAGGVTIPVSVMDVVVAQGLIDDRSLLRLSTASFGTTTRAIRHHALKRKHCARKLRHDFVKATLISARLTLRRIARCTDLEYARNAGGDELVRSIRPHPGCKSKWVWAKWDAVVMDWEEEVLGSRTLF